MIRIHSHTSIIASTDTLNAGRIILSAIQKRRPRKIGVRSVMSDERTIGTFSRVVVKITSRAGIFGVQRLWRDRANNRMSHSRPYTAHRCMPLRYKLQKYSYQPVSMQDGVKQAESIMLPRQTVPHCNFQRSPAESHDPQAGRQTGAALHKHGSIDEPPAYAQRGYSKHTRCLQR